MSARLGSLDPQGPVARAMADLWWLMLALGVGVLALFLVLLAVGLFRRRGADPSGRSVPTRPSVGRWIILGGIVMPLVIVVVVFGATVQAMRVLPTTAPPDALVVEVIGHQWWWEVRYPDDGVTTADELHIPVGRPVAIKLGSADVIHSFWVPALAGKLDALPDGINTLVLQADQAGRYPGRCAEFCGLEHAQMDLVVVAQPQQEFRSWLAAEQANR